jgi:NitT/TauT family transport system substrate-binding protein
MNRRSALGLLGAAAATVAARPARAASRVRLAAPALDNTALMFYADEMGFFKKAGLDADVQAMANGEAVTVALTGNAIDIGCSEVVSLILAHKRGIPITIIAPSGLQTPRSPVGMFFVQKGSTASSGRDLNGKTIAVVGLNGFAQYGTQAWIDKTGGDSSTVKFIQLSGAQIAVALADGRVDGAFVPEPFVSSVRKVAKAVTNPMAAIAPTLFSSAHFTTLPYAKAHPDEIRRIQSALAETADWANKNRDQSALILEKVAHVAPEIVNASTRAYYGDRLDVADLQPLIDVTARYGRFPSFSAAEMMYQA